MTNICDRICRMRLGEVRYLESLVVVCGNRIIEEDSIRGGRAFNELYEINRDQVTNS